MIRFIEFLSESPVFINMDQPGNTVLGTGKDREYFSSIDDKVLKKDFTMIDPGFLKDKTPCHFWLRNDKKYLVGRVKGETAFFMGFKGTYSGLRLPRDISFDHILQETKLYTPDKFKGNNLTRQAYMVLLNRGFVIISDEYHFPGGLQTWISMAKKANTYKINAFDKNTGEYITTSTGKPKVYKSEKIKSIWSELSDSEEADILAVLRKK